MKHSPLFTWRGRNSPRPPSLRRVENQLQRHVRKFTGPSPRCLDPHHRPPFAPLLLAHRDWRLASHPQRQGTPAGHPPETGDSPPESRGIGQPRLRIVIALTFIGDVGTICAAISVAVDTVSLGATSDSGTAVSLPLLVLYVGSRLAMAMLGTRTSARKGDQSALPGIPARLRARADRRRTIATARINAYFRVLAADTALTLTAAFHDPATTTALASALNEEKPR